MISFIVPAHNEEALIGRTLAALRDSAECVLNEPYEIVVVDDASTDRTSEIAVNHGARAVCRQGSDSSGRRGRRRLGSL